MPGQLEHCRKHLKPGRLLLALPRIRHPQPMQGLLWKIRGTNQSGPVYDCQQHFVHPFISLHFTCARAGCWFYRLCIVRPVSRHYVVFDAKKMKKSSRYKHNRHMPPAVKGMQQAHGFLFIFCRTGFHNRTDQNLQQAARRLSIILRRFFF